MSYTSWNDTVDDGLATLQRSLIDIEADTASQRGYNPDLIPGLLQTPDYARAVLTRCSAVLGLPDDSEATATARMERQAVLDAPGHQFRLLIGEAALLQTVGSAAVMAAQLRALAETLTARENVEIGIIPVNAEFVAPTTNFVINDTISVDIETVTGSIEAHGIEEIAVAERTFALLAAQAAYGDEARVIVDRALATHTTD
ncbi:DUF5753 domain-containing protein [Nocardia salmonicida]|uniref:DUF5753 domain-containing protein n=1 Tax=Nocardia salmonicida TaxID=53431 RepID=UPI0033E700BF